MHNKFEIKDFRGFVRRRKNIFLIIFSFIFLTGLVVALSLPPIYKSEAMIRVEGQQIPKHFVNPSMEGFVEERLEILSQQILTRQNLSKIISDYDLYSQSTDNGNIDAMISAFKDDITIETVNAEIKGAGTSKNRYITIAFTLAYEGKDPITVKNVAEELTKFYLEEDIKVREQAASATTEFFKNELNRLKNDIRVQEKKISEFKTKHLGELPSDTSANFMAISRLERDLEKIESNLKVLREQKVILESQFAIVEPLTPIVIDGKDIAMNPKERLKELHFELSALRSTYSEKHPDIKKVKREIKELEKRVGMSDETTAKIKRLNDLENKLAIMQAQLGHNHPDVKENIKEINTLNMQLDEELFEKTKIEYSNEKPDNPAYLNLKAKIQSNDIEIQANLIEKENLKNEIKIFEAKVNNAPFVEKEFIELTRDYDSANQKYHEMLKKLQDAQITQKMENRQRGEKFIVVSPANLPTSPFKPERGLIVLLSLAISLGIASFLAGFTESIDDSIKTIGQLKNITGVPVLTSLSYIITDREKRIKRFKQFAWSLSIVICVCFCLYLVNKSLIKLDYLLSIILERIRMIV